MTYVESKRLAQIATKSRLPATSMFPPFAAAGGLIAYGPDIPASLERCAALVAKILAGAKPGDLPVERPIKFDFILNLKAARELQLTVPESIVLRADKVLQ
jgi:putative ABC transport system substrate-binding protein